jgi:PAS domain-containing protein
MLTMVCLLVFTRAAPETNTSPALLYAPLPFLLWAAVRFGPGHQRKSAAGGAARRRRRGRRQGAVPADIPAGQCLAMQSLPDRGRHSPHDPGGDHPRAGDRGGRARASEQRLQLALDAAQMGTWEWEIGTGRGVWSESSAAILGFRRRATVPWRGSSSSSSRRIAPRSPPPSKRGGRGTPYDVQFRIRHPDGSVRWIHAKATALRMRRDGPPVWSA